MQAQALPIIMSGRDCIGIAKTGSGKTLAFVLPMLRHIKDQPPLNAGDGPVGLVMAPTRELVQQIAKEVGYFGLKLQFFVCFCVACCGLVNDQPPLNGGNGPVGLVMVPTRKLGQQIAQEVGHRTFVHLFCILCIIACLHIPNRCFAGLLLSPSGGCFLPPAVQHST